MVGQTQWLILMVQVAVLDNDGHDIRTFRLNSSDGSSDSNDRIILNGTDGSSSNVGDGLMLEQINITLEGVDSELMFVLKLKQVMIQK